MSAHPLISPRGSRTGELLNLDVALQVSLSPILRSIRDQCLRRGPIGFLHLADASGVKFSNNGDFNNINQVFMEPDRYRNLLIDSGMRISKEEGQALNAAFCDPRGYFRITLFYERVISIFYGERRERTEKLFQILAEEFGTTVLSPSRRSQQQQQNSSNSNNNQQKLLTLIRNESQSKWDGTIPKEKREFTQLTFCGLMAGISVVAQSDEEFDDILRSFQPVANNNNNNKQQEDVAAARTAHLFETQTSQRVVKLSSPIRQKLAEHQKPENCPRHIAGFMGHISYASEHFGKTHYQTMREIPKVAEENRKKLEAAARDVPPEEMLIKYRGGNKSNFHNFSLS